MYTKLIGGRRARPLAATAAAALLAGLTIIGCGGSSASAATTGGTLTFPNGAGPCYEWPGVQNLSTSGLSLQRMADDLEIYGPGSSQAASDQEALAIAQMGLNHIVMQLPDSWVQAVQGNWVLSVNGSSIPYFSQDRCRPGPVASDRHQQPVLHAVVVPNPGGRARRASNARRARSQSSGGRGETTYRHLGRCPGGRARLARPTPRSGPGGSGRRGGGSRSCPGPGPNAS